MISFQENEKWDGLSEPLLNYIRRIAFKCQLECESSTESTTYFCVCTIVVRLLEIMYHKSLGTVIKFNNSIDIQNLFYEIRSTWVYQELEHQLNTRSHTKNPTM